MEREIFRRRVLLLIGTIVCVHVGVFSAAAQEPSPTQQGLITTFAPIVEKQPVKNAKDLVAISKKLKSNEKILIRVWSQCHSGFVALEPK
jgi:hypothetical protein